MSRTIALATTGSRMFQTHFDNSDKDMISIIVDDWIEVFDENSGYKFENNTSIYELNKFMHELLNGNLACHQLLWTGREFFKTHTDDFHIIVSNRLDFINLDVLSHWLDLAQYYFGKATRLGTLQLQEKTILDYLMFLYTNYASAKPRSLKEVLLNKKLDPFSTSRADFSFDNFGLFEAGLGENIYKIYEDYAASKNNPSKYPGIVSRDGALLIGQEPEKENSRVGFKGVVWYDKKGFEKYTRLKNQLEMSNVKNGYASKSMYHAFRTLKCVDHILRYNVLPTTVPDPVFLKGIRTHQENLNDLKKKFKEGVDVVKNMLQEYAGPTHSNTALAKDIIIKIKGPTVGRKPVTPYANANAYGYAESEETFHEYGG